MKCDCGNECITDPLEAIALVRAAPDDAAALDVLLHRVSSKLATDPIAALLGLTLRPGLMRCQAITKALRCSSFEIRMQVILSGTNPLTRSAFEPVVLTGLARAALVLIQAEKEVKER